VSEQPECNIQPLTPEKNIYDGVPSVTSNQVEPKQNMSPRRSTRFRKAPERFKDYV